MLCPYNHLWCPPELSTKHIRQLEAGAAALRVRRCLVGEAHTCGACPLLGERERATGDCHTAVTATYGWHILSEFYIGEMKVPFDRSVWFGYWGTWFHCCVKLNSVAVTDLSLAAWKTKSHKSLNRNRANQTFVLLDWLLLFTAQGSLQLIFVHCRHVQYWKQISQFAISRLFACFVAQGHHKGI